MYFWANIKKKKKLKSEHSTYHQSSVLSVYWISKGCGFITHLWPMNDSRVACLVTSFWVVNVGHCSCKRGSNLLQDVLMICEFRDCTTGTFDCNISREARKTVIVLKKCTLYEHTAKNNRAINGKIEKFTQTASES